jgi:hypothetical protein
MNRQTLIVFTRFGMGDAPTELQQRLAVSYLTLLTQQMAENPANRPGAIACYGEGVRLACAGSPALEPLRALAAAGTHVILCQTCLNFLALRDAVEVGVVGGMTDIMAAMELADKVISL